ncbi:DUF2577 family protein [Clostridium butyricum]|uniref:DUF2577 family protein n=1 Tax=Clostridium butyricum TaxID=1492 RepID=UPI002AB2A1CC|nr:DUF2577 family protein [Clostridium butyricum]
MWDIELAKEFKKRNNAIPDEAVIGKVNSVNPVSISLFNGQSTFSGEQVYVSGSLSVYTGTCEVDGKTSTCTIDRSLKVGDSVLCVPTNNGQKWFIVEVIQ